MCTSKATRACNGAVGQRQPPPTETDVSSRIMPRSNREIIRKEGRGLLFFLAILFEMRGMGNARSVNQSTSFVRLAARHTVRKHETTNNNQRERERMRRKKTETTRKNAQKKHKENCKIHAQARRNLLKGLHGIRPAVTKRKTLWRAKA